MAVAGVLADRLPACAGMWRGEPSRSARLTVPMSDVGCKHGASRASKKSKVRRTYHAEVSCLLDFITPCWPET